MVHYASAVNAVSQARPRLIMACALSAMLHVWLLIGIPINPTGGVPKVVSVITAHLEAAAPEPADEVVAVGTVSSEPATDSLASEVVEPVAPVAVVGQRQSSPATEVRRELPSATGPAPTPSAGIEVPFIRDPTYYPAKQLDVYPQPLTPIRLEYPPAAANARVDGRLTVLVLIDEFGIVNDVSVVEAKPAGYFEEAATAEFRAARFSPAEKQGHPVKSRVMLQVKYLYGESVNASASASR